MGQRRSLLILDGLEPLQYAPTAPTPGELKDQGVAALLRALAAASHGLCIVTTRYSLPDLKAFWQTTAPEVKLLRLSRDAGVHLLKRLGVKGSDLRNIPLKDGDEKSEKVNEFEKLVEDVKGHALTLTLLGGFLKRAFHGDIRQRDHVKFEKADEKMDGGHAFRTMAAYEQWLLRDGGDEGRREVAVLRLMGLFDRPADPGCLNALLQPPVISGLTDPLVGLAEDDWEFCLTGLESAKLLTVHRDRYELQPSASSLQPSLDAHPHLREYFAKQLREQKPEAWRAAHRRLYEHLCASTPDKSQPTLEDLQPLYQAVAHGCQAGMHNVTLIKTYLSRIHRCEDLDSDAFYATRRLGAFMTDLQVLAGFFTKPWHALERTLDARTQGFIFHWVASRLRALGRFDESMGPFGISLSIAEGQHDDRAAAIRARHLSETYLLSGYVAGAVELSKRAVNHAKRCSNSREQIIELAVHGNSLNQVGKQIEAAKAFGEAEALLRQFEPEQPFLYSLWGYMYLDLLMDSEGADNAVSRAKAILDAAGRKSELIKLGLLDRPVILLALAKAHLRRFQGGHADVPLEIIREKLNEAVSGLRKAGYQEDLVRGLLARAEGATLAGALDTARADLDEAREIAERGPMKLHIADIHLYRARLFGRRKAGSRKRKKMEAKYPWESPQADLAAAEELINKCGYHRRDEELADAKRAIA